MVTVTARARVNQDDPTAVVLTADQVWRGLAMRARARDPRFVPPGHRFRIITDEGDHLVRHVLLDDGHEELERITFHGGRIVVVDLIEGRQRSLMINTIETDDYRRLVLNFTHVTEFIGMEHGSPEERALAAHRLPTTMQLPAATLETIRELVAEGRL